MKAQLVNLGVALSNYLDKLFNSNRRQESKRDLNVYLDSRDEKTIIQWSGIGNMSLIEVYSVLSGKVQSFKLTGDTNQIDLSNQPNGIYVYRVMTATGKLIGLGKLIINK